MKIDRLSLMSLCAAALLAAAAPGCSPKRAAPALSGADSARIVAEIEAHRADADSFFRTDPSSPFLNDSLARYDGIKWFPPDVAYRVSSTLHRYPSPATVTVLGTRGEERKQLRYGYFLFTIGGEELRLNAYKFTADDPKRYEQYRAYLSVWFTDETTGKETYEVGRYLDVGEEQPDPDAVYTLDFNNAYNPYCSYSARYSCAIPTKEDRLGVAIRAGELKYHQ
jgi:uncharacterized protein (DUF1684 family)